ncbi:MAG: CdiI immunity protein [Nocardioides sp.]|jgi:hypothetical protein|nr:CdiI immunity protein [Nocardioides sp.]
MSYDELDTLMGAYFHQDFDETGGLRGTVDLYLDEADEPRIGVLLTEIDLVLDTYDEPGLADLLSSLGCAAHLEGPDAYRSWLRSIRSRAQDRVDAAKAG